MSASRALTLISCEYEDVIKRADLFRVDYAICVITAM